MATETATKIKKVDKKLKRKVTEEELASEPLSKVDLPSGGKTSKITKKKKGAITTEVGTEEMVGEETPLDGEAKGRKKAEKRGDRSRDFSLAKAESKGRRSEKEVQDVESTAEQEPSSMKRREKRSAKQPPEEQLEVAQLPEVKAKGKKKQASGVEADNVGITPVKQDLAPSDKKSTQVKTNKKSKKPSFESEPDAEPVVATHTTKKSQTSKTGKSKPTPKAPSASPDPAPSISGEDEDRDVDMGENSEDEEVHLHGFSTDDDSSDEEIMDQEPSGLDVGKLPTIAKDDATVKRKLDKAKRQPTEDRGVLYLGRLPHGFYEDQLKSYFTQFGNVTRLRVSRNKKTGHSKHCAFLEFDSSSVAQIVADTMDNYLLMGHILRCKVIPKDEVHPELWVGANRKWKTIPRDRIARVQHNKSRTEEELERTAKRLIKRQSDRKRKLEESGIKYDFESVSYKKPKPVEA